MDVRIYYTNHRGAQSWRHIKPIKIFYGSTEWHTEDQWLLSAYDFEKNAYRDFAMRDIQVWDPAGGQHAEDRE